MKPNFDDSKWPQAFEYLDQEVGIMGVPGYWRYPEAFIGGALDLDDQPGVRQHRPAA